MVDSVVVPARVLRAAALFASRDESRRILCSIRVMWDKQGRWEVNSTDSYRLFEAWEGCLVDDVAGSLILPLGMFSDLKAADDTASVDIQTGEVVVTTKKGFTRTLSAQPIEGAYPNTHRILGWDTETELGCAEALSARYLADFCKATDILVTERSQRSIRLLHTVPKSSLARSVAVIDWPGLQEEPFFARGVLMPVRS